MNDENTLLLLFKMKSFIGIPDTVFLYNRFKLCYIKYNHWGCKNPRERKEEKHMMHKEKESMAGEAG